MSLSSLAQSEVRRSAGPRPAARARSLQERSSAETPEPAEPEPKNGAPNALQSLIKYIPTESATLYLAAVSAQAGLLAITAVFTPLFSYFFFAALTPVLLLLILAANRRAAGLRPFPALPDWPWWKLAASLIAFLAWGLAVPSNPFNTSELRGTAFAFVALFVSTILSILEGVMEPGGSG